MSTTIYIHPADYCYYNYHYLLVEFYSYKTLLREERDPCIRRRMKIRMQQIKPICNSLLN